MDAVTYPQKEVTSFIKERMVPLHLLWNTQPQAKKYKVMWTPTLLVIGPDGREHHRTVGYLPPKELLPSLLLGTAKWLIAEGQYQEAREELDALLVSYPGSDSGAEAVYVRGIALFKHTGEISHMKFAYDTLVEEYPDSPWRKRAEPYRNL